MKLYHYTSVPIAETILSSSLSRGHLRKSDNTIIHDVVWLTSDPSSDGHGLTNGTEKLTSSNVRHLEEVQGAPLRNKMMHNKTAIRLTYNLPEDWQPIIQNFVEYSKIFEDKYYAKIMGLSCYIDIQKVSDKLLKSMYKNKKTKEKTWWISFIAIPSKFISAVDFKCGDKYIPYNFELHGRTGMAEVGFIIPSADTISTLRPLLPGLNAFENASARIICPTPEHEPIVHIRGQGTDRIFRINDGKFFAGTAATQNELEAWVLQHKDELMTCWHQAVSSYKEFYPED
jgi:hypothetical protein